MVRLAPTLKEANSIPTRILGYSIVGSKCQKELSYRNKKIPRSDEKEQVDRLGPVSSLQNEPALAMCFGSADDHRSNTPGQDVTHKISKLAMIS